jgi:hypothetical protein
VGRAWSGLIDAVLCMDGLECPEGAWFWGGVGRVAFREDSRPSPGLAQPPRIQNTSVARAYHTACRPHSWHGVPMGEGKPVERRRPGFALCDECNSLITGYPTVRAF